MPRGIFIGILVIIALYLAVSYSYYKIIGFEELKTSKELLPLLLKKYLARPADTFFHSCYSLPCWLM